MQQTHLPAASAWSPYQALREASRCLYCHDAPCVQGCPAEIKIPDFIHKIKTGNLRGAARVIYESNAFGAVCADVCPQAELCRKGCTQANLDEAINIGRLQKFALESAGLESTPLPPNGKKVAVIGAGPAGLSGAYALMQKGYEAVVFEAGPDAGGTALWGIPDYRLEYQILERELSRITKVVRDIRYSVTVGGDVPLETLLAEYDAVLVSCGLGSTSALEVPGAGLSGVYPAEKFLAAYNLKMKLGTGSQIPVGAKVVVIGGGNTAMDAACIAKRAGARQVTVAYRRSLAEMPAWQEEYRFAVAQGIEFRWLTAPVAVLGTDQVTGIKLISMELGPEDETGRKRPVAVPGSEFDLAADMVIVATGQSQHPLLKKLAGLPKVYLAGDAANGGKTVVQAVAEGQKAAIAIDHYLQNALKQSGGASND
ncbi:MAG: NAD(P)-dependent oxidoreductase [Syntrophomonadaceae bacterium]|nr:NAD(P)-dependent oxidoreductase [Syntrophomonadaceae bacterium]